MKKFIIIIISVISIGGVFAQKKTSNTVVSSTSSSPVKVVILGADTLKDIPTVQYPPILEISELSLTGIENEGFISGGEKAYLHFTIRNNGQGNAYNVRLFTLETTGIEGLKYDNHKYITQQIKSGEKHTDSVFIESNNKLQDGKAKFELNLSEANGNKSPSVTVSLFTRRLKRPNVEILNYDIYTLSDTELCLQMTVKNTGSSNMKDVKVSIDYPNTVYVKGDNMKILPLLQPDESSSLDFIFVKNQSFDENVRDVFKINFEDNNGRILGRQKEILRVPVKNTTSVSRAAGDETAEISILSDIDVNIPVSPSNRKRTNTYALIIGNETYLNNQTVPYAINDARSFSVYCIQTFNIPTKNITVLINASGNQMKESLRELVRMAMYDAKGEAEIIIYYSGHGIIAKGKNTQAEDEFDQYLIPVDVSKADPTLSISRQDIYSMFNDVPLSRISLFLDACNVPGDRALVKEAKYEWKGNVFVFASSSPKQTSVSYHEKKHGLFTYFLLKSIQEKKGIINYKDLTEMVILNVERQSNNMSGLKQTPEVKVSPDTGESWMKWRIP